MKAIFRTLFFLLLFNSCTNTENSEVNDESQQTQEQPTSTATKKKSKRIVFLGNSLTAAYGLDPKRGFTSLIQNKIDSLGLDYEVVNAGLSGETTAGGAERVDWILNQPVDIFVLELGGNDGLRGIEPEASYQNLKSIVDKVQEKYPEAKIILAGMEAPPNMGPEFTRDFREMYPQLAKEEQLTLIPFLLKDVGGIPKLNLPDGIHPNVEGQKIVAENVWEVLFPLL